MECHYKVLGLELNADEDAIKKAYRKAALKYHPDKNPDSLEEATERFRLVQAAYEVLSDPQEKAWYDRHREEILHRKKYENYKQDSLDLFEYFTPSAYKGFGDDDNGFYSVYRDVFIKINSEDEPFRYDDSNNKDMPLLGDSGSDYDDVVHIFYSSWQAYSTSMSFVWVNQYDVKEAPNRRIARIIEKENKKERDKHKKKRNELVRELVTFVRKRDPRVKAHKLELEQIALEQSQKAEERRISAIRERVKEAALYDEMNKKEIKEHHDRVAELEDMMKGEFGFSSSDEDVTDEEEDYKDELFCVACNKLFKSEMGLRNHKKSKKHKENVNRLQEEMRNEHEVNSQSEDTEDKKFGLSDDDDLKDEKLKHSKLSKKQKKQRRQQQKLLKNMTSEASHNGEIKSEEKEISGEEKATETEDKHETENQLKTESDNCPLKINENDVVDKIVENVKTPIAGGTKQSHANASKKTVQKKQRQQDSKPDITNAEPLGCGKCTKVFPSRNKLFQHLKQTGHSLPLTENLNKTSKCKEKKNRK